MLPRMTSLTTMSFLAFFVIVLSLCCGEVHVIEEAVALLGAVIEPVCLLPVGH